MTLGTIVDFLGKSSEIHAKFDMKAIVITTQNLVLTSFFIFFS